MSGGYTPRQEPGIARLGTFGASGITPLAMGPTITGMPRDPSEHQAPRWSGVGGGCLVVLIVLAGLVWFLTTIARGEPDRAVPDSHAGPAHSTLGVEHR